jgi:hypothetical protein
MSGKDFLEQKSGWSYADLVSSAKAAGGPEEFLDLVSDESGKEKFIYGILSGVLASGLICVTIKGFKFVRKKYSTQKEKFKQDILVKSNSNYIDEYNVDNQCKN